MAIGPVRKIVILAVAWLIAGEAISQSDWVISDSHYDAAEELVQLIGSDKAMQDANAVMTNAMIQQNPVLAPYRDVLLEWGASFMNWESMGPSMVNLYAESFTEQELIEILDFYMTPAGGKTLTLMPELMQKGMAIGQTLAAERLPELELMIEERADELQRLSEGSGTNKN